MAENNPYSALSAVEIFDVKKHQFDVWLDVFELHFIRDALDPEKKVMYFLTRLGMAAYTDLRAMCGAKKPETCTFVELTAKLENFYNPKPSEVAERSKFRSRLQKENESLSAYVVEMQKLARTCNFGDSLQENLRDSIAHGVKDDRLKSKLFEDKSLTYRKVIETCEAWEGTQISLQLENRLKNGKTDSSSIHTSDQRINRVRDTGGKEKCTCCGKLNHKKEKCRYRNLSCNFCSIKGHLENICRKKKEKTEKNDEKKSVKETDKKEPATKAKKVHNVERKEPGSGDESDGIFLRRLYTLRTIKPDQSSPTFLDVEVEGVTLPMELDNGADISCISEKLYNEKFQKFPIMQASGLQVAYDSHEFSMIGYIEVKAQLQGNMASDLKLYIVKNGAHPLLGREWYPPLGIELTVKIHQMVNTDTTDDLTPDKEEQLIKETIESFTKTEFPDVFTNELGHYKYSTVSLVLREGAKPKFCRPRPLPYSLKDKVAAEIRRLVEAKKWVPVQVSEWGTPVVPVAKSNGDIRLCGDYKVTVNPELVTNRYPLPIPEDNFNKVGGSEYYTTFDLAHAYQQLGLDKKSQEILTLSTHMGLYQPLGLMFGVETAPADFQRVMDMLLLGIEFVACFLDDVICGGRNLKHHINICREVLSRFQKAGLTLAVSKCVFFKPRLKYLGFYVDKFGVSIDPVKLEAILKAPTPQTKKEVQAFLGILAYVIKFVPNAATVLRPLYDLLKKDAPEKITLTDEIINALVTAKKLVKEASFLAHYDPSKPVILRCDASPVGIGGVLLHLVNGEEIPIAYTSRTLTSTEKIYAQVDREALAIVYCIQKFDKYLYGIKFVLETDNSALTFIFGDKRDLGKVVANRVSRYCLFLRDYKFEIRHVPKEKNIVADGLSRLPVITVTDVDKHRINFLSQSLSFLNRDKIQSETSNDVLLQEINEFVVNGWPEVSKKRFDRKEINLEVRPFYVRRYDISTEDGLLYFEHRIIIPKSLQKVCLNELHRGHVGVVKMKSLARCHFWWPGIDTEIEQLTNNCKICCENRKNPPLTTLHKWKYPAGPGERIHADFGHYGGKTFLLITDQYSKWLELYWLTSTTADKTIQCFRQYFSCWGLVTLVVTDNGPPFSSTEFNNFLSQNGVNHLTSAVEHPRSNGAAEVMVGTVKNKLKKIMLSGVPFDEAVHNFLLEYRTTVHQTTGKTPAELHLNRKIATRFDVMLNRKFQKERQNFPGKREVVLHPEDKVLIRQYRKPTKWVEGEVVKPVGNALAEVISAEGIQKRHKDQLIKLPATVEPDVNAPLQNEPESSTIEPVDNVDIPKVNTEPELSLRRSGRDRKSTKRLIEEM